MNATLFDYHPLPQFEAIARSDEESNGNPVLDDGSVIHVRMALEDLIVGPPEWRRSHRRGLRQYIRETRHSGTLSKAEVQKLCMSGLDGLSSKEVARLVLNGTAIEQLATELEEKDGYLVVDAWSSARGRVGNLLWLGGEEGRGSEQNWAIAKMVCETWRTAKVPGKPLVSLGAERASHLRTLIEQRLNVMCSAAWKVSDRLKTGKAALEAGYVTSVKVNHMFAAVAEVKAIMSLGERTLAYSESEKDNDKIYGLASDIERHIRFLRLAGYGWAVDPYREWWRETNEMICSLTSARRRIQSINEEIAFCQAVLDGDCEEAVAAYFDHLVISTLPHIEGGSEQARRVFDGFSEKYGALSPAVRDWRARLDSSLGPGDCLVVASPNGLPAEMTEPTRYYPRLIQSLQRGAVFAPALPRAKIRDPRCQEFVRQITNAPELGEEGRRRLLIIPFDFERSEKVNFKNPTQGMYVRDEGRDILLTTPQHESTRDVTRSRVDFITEGGELRSFAQFYRYILAKVVEARELPDEQLGLVRDFRHRFVKQTDWFVNPFGVSC